MQKYWSQVKRGKLRIRANNNVQYCFNLGTSSKSSMANLSWNVFKLSELKISFVREKTNINSYKKTTQMGVSISL